MRISILTLLLLLFACKKEIQPNEQVAYRQNKKITYNNITIDVIIDKPAFDALNVLVVFHGTIQNDSSMMTAATTALNNFKSILERSDVMVISVAYPQENLLLGDNIKHAEAALLWVKNKASEELGITIKKIFLAGHSQGGYVVTRLNTMHTTDGVVANAPGPLNLVYRCELEEKGNIPTGATCTKLKDEYGTTINNPTAYMERSLLHFTQNYQSDILFVQGLNDSPIQLYSWPTFKLEVSGCVNCKNIKFVEIQGGEHAALFSSTIAKKEFNLFIDNRIE